MKTEIWKYPLGAICTDLKMPNGSKILTVQIQNDNATLWAIVPTVGTVEQSRRFRLHPTGAGTHEIKGDYIGTVQQANGLVWHVFEEIHPFGRNQ